MTTVLMDFDKDDFNDWHSLVDWITNQDLRIDHHRLLHMLLGYTSFDFLTNEVLTCQ